MKTPKKIAVPQCEGAEGIKEMTALELNAVKFSEKHTVLTPQLLAAHTAATVNS